ncbi:unnamed protein product [Polarella glacialis]|uniref:Uncharacterized protein n=2 Tax=Polarella glacialis TaxID=89957 RepID=A0A813HQM6_POLGL|nr:unnamed protein product [Polarella glacialis]
MELSAWLREVDPTGALDGYLAVLEETCSDVDEVNSRYISVDELGRKALSLELFNDLGVQDLSHQQLFLRGVSKGFVPAPRKLPGPSATEQNLMGLMGSIHSTAENVSAELRAGKPAVKTTADKSSLDFRCWLRLVDPSGELDGYASALEENYDVEDMDQLWSGSIFFEELQITEFSHQQLFGKYFKSRAAKEPT